MKTGCGDISDWSAEQPSALITNNREEEPMSTNAHRVRTVGARMVFARAIQRAGARRAIVDCSRRVDRAKSIGGNRIAWLAALSALVVLAAPAAAQANTVTNWNRIAVETLVALAPASGGAPPASQINMAMTQGAVY